MARDFLPSIFSRCLLGCIVLYACASVSNQNSRRRTYQWTAASAARVRKRRLYRGACDMAESVYKVIELVGTSTESWEKAAGAAVEKAAKTLRDLRVAEISELDIQLKDGKLQAYRAKVKVSFKYEGE